MTKITGRIINNMWKYPYSVFIVGNFDGVAAELLIILKILSNFLLADIKISVMFKFWGKQTEMWEALNMDTIISMTVCDPETSGIIIERHEW